MRLASFVLTLLGGVLAVVGIAWAALAAVQRRRQLERERAIVLRENAAGGNSADRLRQMGVPFTTWGDVITTRQDVEIAILTDALSNLRGPALVVLLGGVLSTIGGVLGLWA